jgi:hypothetical protein
MPQHLWRFLPTQESSSVALAAPRPAPPLEFRLISIGNSIAYAAIEGIASAAKIG